MKNKTKKSLIEQFGHLPIWMVQVFDGSMESEVFPSVTYPQAQEIASRNGHGPGESSQIILRVADGVKTARVKKSVTKKSPNTSDQQTRGYMSLILGKQI
jgi:hypothetical protein